MLIGQTDDSKTKSNGEKIISEVSEENFVSEVIEKSKKIPVIVDFWAPWCGPCKQITPALEKAVNLESGKVILAKINIDENQSVAAQLRIQSIPTIYAFHDGQPVDGFMGAQPETAIIEFVKKISSLNQNEPNLNELIESANNELVNKHFSEAKKIFEKILNLEPLNVPATSGLIRSLIGLDDLDVAEKFIQDLNKEVLDEDEVKKSIAALSLIKTSKSYSKEINALEIKIEENPNDLKSIFDLASAFFGSNESEKAINLLLKIISINPEWDDQAARRKLLEFFSAIGHTDPIVIQSRKKLSSLIFK